MTDADKKAQNLKKLAGKKAEVEKQLEELEKEEYDRKNPYARKEHEQKRKELQAQVDSAGAALAAEEDAQTIGEMSESEQDQLARYAVSQVDAQNKPVEWAELNANPVLGLFGNQPNAVTGEDFTDLFGKVGSKTRADELAETLMRDENAELNQKAAEVGQKAADDHPLLSSLLSVPVSAVSGVVGTVGQLQSAARSTGRYQTTDPNATGTALQTYSGAIRGQVAQNITGDIYDEEGNLTKDGGVLRQGLSLLYQGTMSLADSIARAYIGGGSLGGSALAGLNTFSQTMAEAAEKGATPGQAALLATANAFIDAATEKVPLDELISVAKGKNAVSVVKNLLRQAGIEATEEELSLIGSLAAEAAILQEKSDLSQTIQSLMDAGLSKKEATAQAWRGVWDEAVQTAIVSGISGAIGGFGAAVKGGNLNQDTKESVTAEQLKQQAIENNRTRHEQQLAAEAADTSVPSGEADTQQTKADAILDGVVPKNQEPVQAEAPTKADEVVNKTLEDIGLKKKQRDSQQKETYEALAAAKRVAKNLQKDISKTEANIEKGKGSPARLAQLQSELERQNKLVADLESQYAYFTEDYEKNITAAIVYQQILFDDMKQKAAQAIADNEAGKITDAQLKVANEAYMTAGDTLRRLKNMTQDEYRAYLAESGLVADVDYGAIERDRKPQKLSQDSADRIADILNNGDYAVSQKLKNAEVRTKNGKWLTPDTSTGDATVNTETTAQPNATPTGQNPQSSAPQVDTPRASTEGGQTVSGIEAVGAAEQNFSGKAEYQNLLSDENSQRDRPGDVRPVEVPKTDSYGRNVSEFVGNAYGAAATPDRMANEIENLVQEGALGFDRRSNRESLENARDYIYGKDGAKGRGEAATRNEITRNIASGKIQDGDIEKAMLLYTGYANRKSDSSQQNAAELMVDLSTMANMTGRNLQLFKLMRQLTPEGQLYTLETEIRRSIDHMQKTGSVPKDYEVSFDPELQQEYLTAAQDVKNAKSPEAKKNAEQSMKALQDAIYMSSAAELPVTQKEKWDTWRYMCMLGNPKTQVRNVVGNVSFKPYKVVKDTMAAGFERLFLPQDQRTKSVLNPLSENDRALLDWAKADSKTEAVNDALKYSAKLGDDVTTDKLSKNRRIFKNDKLETLRKATEWLPEAGDMIFKNDYYQKSMAGFLKSRGITATDVQSGNVDVAILNEGRTYAIQEAMKATFNDCNVFSDFLATNLRYKGDNPVGKVANIIGEGVIPFRRTPANIIVRFGEYSPAGLLKTAWDVATKVRTGKMTAATAIDGLCSNLTGSAAMALGYVLADGLLGIRIVGSDVSEDEQRQGHQAYSLEWDWKGETYSYTIDWAAPANLPLFVGANLYSALKGQGGDTNVSNFTAVVRAILTSLEPMLSLSCLSSFSELFENARYADEGEELYTVLAGIATSYFSQGIPSLARQAYQASKKNKQTTFANSEDATIRDLQKTAANVPFLGSDFKTDKINEWGEKTEQGGLIERVFNSFVNPGTAKKIDNSDLEKEITRLNQAQETNVAPNAASKTVSYTDSNGTFHKDVRLTKEQYEIYATTQGQTSRQLAEGIISNPSYAALTDEQKAKAISDAYSYAKKKAEIATFDDHTGYSETWMQELQEGKEADAIIRRVTNSSLSSALSSVSEAWSKDYDVTASSEELETAYESYSSLSSAQKKTVLADASTSVKNYVEARDSGVSHDKYLFIKKTISELKSDNLEKAKNARPVQKAEAVVNTSGLSEKQKEILVKQYVPDSQNEDIDELKALAKENKAFGNIYDMELYTELYRDKEDYTSGTGKKNRTISHWVDVYDLDWATARKLYEIFS